MRARRETDVFQAPVSPSCFLLFSSCFKIFGLYERARGVHKLYGVPWDRDAKSRCLEEYNVPAAFSPPAAENTADKAHKLRDEGGTTEDGSGRTCPMSSDVASNIP